MSANDSLVPLHDPWEELEARILTCRRCPRLVAWRETVARVKRRAYREETYWGRPVPGFGDRQGRVLVVGLAPGAHGANRTGRMFTGDASGAFLYAALYRAGFANQPTSRHRGDGLRLRDMYITAVVRCVPPKNRPTAAEIRACVPYLAEEIQLMQPRLRVIVALGRIAFDGVRRAYAILGQSLPRWPFVHAARYALGPEGPYLIASYHPSRQNTQTGRLTSAMFDRVWQQVRALLPDPPPLPPQEDVHHEPERLD
ncbi:MAG: uracil-DNA glycosylase [Chloroflexi bacterium]|nr:uracil-DNA glycosylase [Chloroflexota bacterium]